MILTIPDDLVIGCWICGSTENDISTVPIKVDGKLKGLIMACKGECSEQLNLSSAKIDFIGNKKN